MRLILFGEGSMPEDWPVAFFSTQTLTSLTVFSNPALNR